MWKLRRSSILLRRSSSSMTAHAMGHGSSWSGWIDEIDKLKIIQTPGLGLPAARNRAVREASGEFIAILDGDDFWMPEKLERQFPAFARGGKIGLVYSDFVDFSRDDAADGRVITVRRFNPESAHQLRDYFVHDGPIMPSTLVVRRSVFDDVGLFDESLLIGQDTAFCLRVATSWRFATYRALSPSSVAIPAKSRRGSTLCYPTPLG